MFLEQKFCTEIQVKKLCNCLLIVSIPFKLEVSKQILTLSRQNISEFHLKNLFSLEKRIHFCNCHCLNMNFYDSKSAEIWLKNQTSPANLHCLSLLESNCPMDNPKMTCSLSFFILQLTSTPCTKQTDHPTADNDFPSSLAQI